MERTINLTQHEATDEQLVGGVFDVSASEREELRILLTFERIPTRALIVSRARSIALLAAANRTKGKKAECAMIGGAPFLLPTLATELHRVDIRPVAAFSERKSEEKTMPDGSVRKVAVFRHLGLVGVPT